MQKWHAKKAFIPQIGIFQFPTCEYLGSLTFYLVLVKTYSWCTISLSPFYTPFSIPGSFDPSWPLYEHLSYFPIKLQYPSRIN